MTGRERSGIFRTWNGGKPAAGLFGCALSAGLLALSGCASQPKPPPVLETIIVPLPQNVEAAPPPAEPSPPALINASKGEDLWHLRSALNVAALMCNARSQSGVATSYNKLLRTHRALLTAAVEAELDQFKARDKKSWQALYDRHMTKVYNDYSATRARDAFCAAAERIAADAADLPAEELTDRATALLFRINREAGLGPAPASPAATSSP
jgi:hypothetical protein